MHPPPPSLRLALPPTPARPRHPRCSVMRQRPVRMQSSPVTEQGSPVESESDGSRGVRRSPDGAQVVAMATSPTVSPGARVPCFHLRTPARGVPVFPHVRVLSVSQNVDVCAWTCLGAWPHGCALSCAASSLLCAGSPEPPHLEPSLRGEWRNIAVLVTLYFLQGMDHLCVCAGALR